MIRLVFGAGSDLQIYHDGSNSIIKDNGVGNIQIQTAGQIFIGDVAAAETFALFNNDGAVNLYHNNSEKLATTATGIDVTGTVTATGTSVFASLDISGDIDVDGTTNLDVVDIDGAVDMASTLTVSGLTNLASPVQVRNATQNFNGGLSTEVNSGIINFGLNEGSANRFGGSYTQANQGGFMHFDTRSGEPLFQLYGRTAGTADASGSILFQIDSTGNTVFNDTGVDADFRVESDTNTHALFVEGDGTGVGINTSDPQEALHVTGSVRLDGNNNGITSGEAVNQLIFKDTDTTTGGGQTMGQIDFVTADADAPGVSSRISGVADSSTTGQGRLTLFTGAAGTLSNNITMAAGSVAINEAGADMDFRVESDGNANMLFVDGGNDAVGIGTNVAGNSTLEVRSTGVDGTYANAIGFQYSGNSNEANTISTSVSSNANNSGFKFNVSDGGGSSGKTSVLKITRADMVVNDDSYDYDFRVESNDNENMLFVDGGNNRVGIGKAAASQPFEVGVFSAFDTGMIVNESGADSDFRVESDGQTHALFVDAADDFVGINTSDTQYGHVTIVPGGTVNSNIVQSPNTTWGLLALRRTSVSSAANNATVDVLRFLKRDGSTIMATSHSSGSVYISVRGFSGADQGNYHYSLQHNGLGATGATFTLVSSSSRDTNPVSSIGVVDDGATGGIKVQVTYINNSGVVNGGQCRVLYDGVISPN
jgi:hypothetical protein